MIAVLEFRVALAQRRLFILNTIVPLALVLPIALGGAPRFHAAVVFTLLVTFFGVFGQAIPLARDAERGLTARFFLAGVSPRGFFGERIAAHALLDGVQLAPALLVIALSYQAGGRAFAGLVAAALLALVTANAIGVLIASMARSIAEAALFSSIVALFGLHAAGVFRAPVPGSFADQVRAAVPFARLHQTMQGVLGVNVTPPTSWLTAVVGAAALVALVVLFAPRLAGALTRARPG